MEIEKKKSLAEMEKILQAETMGFLGLAKNDIPYVIPLTYGYFKGRILFHCALKGKKLDYIRANREVCFTVGKQFGRFCPHPQGASCRSSHDSVICYGTARIIENLKERRSVLNQFNRCLTTATRNIPEELAARCYAVEIIIHRMTARKQRKGTEIECWEYKFK